MRALSIAVAILGSFLAGFTLADFLAQDRCLDDGGRWRDYPLLGVCEGLEPRQGF